jgi:2-isopropylmalate synthase
LRRSSSTATVVSERCGVPIPDNYPIVGRDAFRTPPACTRRRWCKAWKKGDRALMDMVYSASPASPHRP